LSRPSVLPELRRTLKLLKKRQFTVYRERVTTCIQYYGKMIETPREVAAFLEASRKQIAASDRKYRNHNVPLIYLDPDETLDTQHCTGRNYLLNVVIRNLENERVRDAVSRLLSGEQWELYRLRYEKNLTQQQIADRLGISKMAVCKRLRKLHGQVRDVLAA
jgi:RNA polymerase sigma factor (sigma-70 family)